LSALPHFGSLEVAAGRIAIDDKVLETALRITLNGCPHPDLNSGFSADVDGRWRALPLSLRVCADGALPLLLDDVPDRQAPALNLRLEGRAGATASSSKARLRRCWGRVGSTVRCGCAAPRWSRLASYWA
jgi:uncharacterized protein involved in outer membrane biogenesis